MPHKKISTKNAPAPIGPYSQAILVDDKFLFVAGQIPLNPKTGNLVEGDIKEQTRQVLQNIEAILLEVNSTFDSIVKTTVFLKDLNEFAAMNEIYSEFFNTSAPARSTVEVARLPRDVHIEIEVIAIIEK